MKWRTKALVNIDSFLPIESSLTDPAVRLDLAEADIVLGHDRSQEPDHLTIFSGKDTLESIVTTNRSREIQIIGFTYDQTTESLELFCAACKTLRGSDDYLSLEQEVFIRWMKKAFDHENE